MTTIIDYGSVIVRRDNNAMNREVSPDTSPASVTLTNINMMQCLVSPFFDLGKRHDSVPQWSVRREPAWKRFAARVAALPHQGVGR